MMNKNNGYEKSNQDQELRKLALLSERELMMELRTSEKDSRMKMPKKIRGIWTKRSFCTKANPSNYFIFKCIQRSVCLCLSLIDGRFNFNEDFEAAIVMGVMILASVLIAFIQVSFSKASLDLKELIENTAAVTREGITKEIPMDEIVPGDIVTLATGDMIPADAVLIWTKDLFVNQSSLTGESMPVENCGCRCGSSTNRGFCRYARPGVYGTDVLSGQAIILKTGQHTFLVILLKC